jgi:hypothetical protein
MTMPRVPGSEAVRNGRTIPLLPTLAVLSSRAVQRMEWPLSASSSFRWAQVTGMYLTDWLAKWSAS